MGGPKAHVKLTNRSAKSDLAVAMFWPTVSVAAEFTSQELAGLVFWSIREGTLTGGSDVGLIPDITDEGVLAGFLSWHDRSVTIRGYPWHSMTSTPKE